MPLGARWSKRASCVHARGGRRQRRRRPAGGRRQRAETPPTPRTCMHAETARRSRRRRASSTTAVPTTAVDDGRTAGRHAGLRGRAYWLQRGAPCMSHRTRERDRRCWPAAAPSQGLVITWETALSRWRWNRVRLMLVWELFSCSSDPIHPVRPLIFVSLSLNLSPPFRDETNKA
jgi:hypothetical protein